MPDLLLEFFSEEIPARMQARAAEDLRRRITDRLVEAGLTYEGAKAFATPRRLALAVQGVPVRQPDVKEERKGPRVDANEKAIAGFLKAAGLASIEQAKIEKDAKRGDFYVALIEKPGRPAIEVIAEIVPEVAKTFPWPKAMRWGERSARPGSLNWVRPLHSIVAMFGPETEEPDVVPFTVDGIVAGDTTFGHRFMAPGPITVRRLSDYVKKLHDAKVVVDGARRAQIIETDARNLAFAQGFDLVEDEGLLAEVAGLVEWPVVLMGSFDESFLAIPQEVIRSTIRNNQRCFVLRDPNTARLVNKFILVANIEAPDGGAAIVSGCERVIRARLSDAKFFYESDLKTRLEDRLAKFQHIVFHEKLGTQAERIARITALAGHLAPLVGADVTKAERAAQLCKADLLTAVVGEFPELQGTMGRYYAEAQAEDEAVAHAIEDHYRPVGPDDLVPSDPVAITVALADKIDMLVGFWAIDEKPTGSKDPYALRRAALGVIRLVLDNSLRLKLIRDCFRFAGERLLDHRAFHDIQKTEAAARRVGEMGFERPDYSEKVQAHQIINPKVGEFIARLGSMEWELLTFFADRLKVQLREQGARHDLVDAVFGLGELGARKAKIEDDAGNLERAQDDLVLIVRRIEALAAFLDTEDGQHLLAGYKRATNIIRIEERKDKLEYTAAPDPALYSQAEEKALAAAIEAAKLEADLAIAREDFASAMAAMAKLRPHVDLFFDKVTVNVADVRLRANRLRLLNKIREATRAVADFSRIEG